MQTSGKRGPRGKRLKRAGERRLPPADPARLERALARMPRLRREIFLAMRFGGMDYGKVARRTGVSVRRVERELAKALCDLDRPRGRPDSLHRRWLWPWPR